MAIIGEDISKSIIQQINARQKLHGSGVKKLRTQNQIKLLNSTNAWLKIASGVSLSEEKAKEIGFSSSSKGTRIPRNYVLFNGTSTYTGKQKQSFIDGSYQKSDFGLVPMAGVSKFNVKNLNRGSLKKATINFTVHSKEQFNIVDVLYLRLGYTVLIEWGNSAYSKFGGESDSDYYVMGKTITDNSNGFFSDDATYAKINEKIQEYRTEKHRGNYDALLGKISNFDWTFKPDGSYDINITVISIGDVIESLKVNLPIPPDMIKTQEFINARNANVEFEGSEKSLLHSLFWVIRYLNQGADTGVTPIPTWDGSNQYIGKTCILGGSDELSIMSYYGKWRYYGWSYDPDGVGNDSNGYDEYIMNYTYYDKKFSAKQVESGECWKWAADRRWSAAVACCDRSNDSSASKDAWVRKYWKNVKYELVTWKVDEESTDKAPNPAAEFSEKDVWKTTHGGAPAFFMRFGALLSYIEKHIIPQYKTPNGDSTPLVSIDYDSSSSYFFMMPNAGSLDTSVCWLNNTRKYPIDFTNVNGTKRKKGIIPFKFVPQLYPACSTDYKEEYTDGTGKKRTLTIDNSHINKGLTMNIYLNFNTIIETLNSNTDEEGNISLYSFIKSLCDKLNLALGKVNNLEPTLDESTNTISIIDTTPIPGEISKNPKTKYKLNLFGYNKSHTQSNFVRKLNIKTAITKEFATMVTVGATAGGYTKGVEATAFSKWNKGIIDRFKEKISSPDSSTKEAEENEFPEAVQSYIDKYIKKDNQAALSTVNAKPFIDGYWETSISKDMADSNISVVSNFYEYAIAKFSELRSGGTTSTVGFIPFKISLTLSGISGIKIYNVLRIDSSFLPKSYGNSLDFIVTAVNHSISNNDWTTEIELTVMPKAGDKATGVIENYDYIFNPVPSQALSSFSSIFNGEFFDSLRKKANAPTAQQGSGTGNGKKTLGTGGNKTSDNLAKNSFADTTELNNAIQSGLNIINNL